MTPGAVPPEGASSGVHVLLYDADCGFCRWAVGRVVRWDRGGRVRPCALQDPEAARWLAGLPQEVRMASWHLVDPQGRVASGGRAVAPLLRLLPFGAPLAALADAFPRVTDAAYGWVARHRSMLGRFVRGGSCRPQR